jgi:hypothetical protein
VAFAGKPWKRGRFLEELAAEMANRSECNAFAGSKK